MWQQAIGIDLDQCFKSVILGPLGIPHDTLRGPGNKNHLPLYDKT